MIARTTLLGVRDFSMTMLLPFMFLGCVQGSASIPDQGPGLPDKVQADTGEPIEEPESDTGTAPE